MKNNLRLHFTSLLLLTYILRLALPFGNYIFFPILLVSSIYAIHDVYKAGFYSSLAKYLRATYPLLTALSILVCWYLFTPGKHEILTIDLIHALSAFAVLFVLFSRVKSTYELSALFNTFRYQVVISSGFIGLAGIIKLYCQFRGIQFEFLDVTGYPWATSLVADRNFFSLFILFGIIGAISVLVEKQKILSSIFYQIILLSLTVNILLSTSRRGMIIASVVLVGTFLLWFISLVHRRESFRNFRANTVGFGILFLLVSALYFHLLLNISSLKRNHWLANSKYNQSEVQIYVNLLTLSAKSIFAGQSDYQEVSREIWQTNFDARYPYSGWAAGNYTPVTMLRGDNVEIVPKSAEGARVDRTVGGSAWSGNAYYYSKLFDGRVEAGKRYVASVYCYVSDDFNGDWVRISSSGDVRGYMASYYDLGLKGRWQKLQISFEGDSGAFTTHFYLSKLNAASFDSLSGHIVFAYPELKEMVFDPNLPITWFSGRYSEVYEIVGRNSNIIPKGATGALVDRSAGSSTWGGNAYNYSQLFSNKIQKGKRYVFSIYCYTSLEFNVDWVRISSQGNIRGLTTAYYDLNRRGEWQKLQTSFEGDSGTFSSFIYLAKHNALSLDSLNGHAVYAYPELKEVEFDPRNPETWAGVSYKPILPLTGENNAIVPRGAIGYKIDRTSQFHASANVVYSSTTLKRDRIVKNKRYITSIYAFVSKDFNGTSVRLAAGGKFFGKSASFYDLGRKGKWQKLTINIYGDTGMEFYSGVYFDLLGEKDFSNLKGYVVFAYPEYSVIKYDPNNPASYAESDYVREYPLQGLNSEIVPLNAIGYRLNRTSQGEVLNNSCRSLTLYNSIQTQTGDSIFATAYCYVSDDFNGNALRIELRGNIYASIGYDLNEKGKWVKLEARGVAKSDGRVYGVLFFSQKDVTDFSTLNGHVTFAYPELRIVKPKSKVVSQQLGRTFLDSRIVSKASILPLGFISSFFSQVDTGLNRSDSLHGAPLFQKEMTDDHFSGPRLDRWRYALHLYRNEYKWWQKVVGGGFDHTSKFAKEFEKDGGYDYPHNPFLSVLLYSGVVGLLVYIWLLFKVVYLYWLYRKEHLALFLSFIATFFYSFFSASSPFDPAVMALFMVLPFAIHFIHVNDKTQRVISQNHNT